jgi:hypothetical protein
MNHFGFPPELDRFLDPESRASFAVCTSSRLTEVKIFFTNDRKSSAHRLGEGAASGGGRSRDSTELIVRS